MNAETQHINIIEIKNETSTPNITALAVNLLLSIKIPPNITL